MVDRRLDLALRARIGSDDILQDAFELAKGKWPEFLRRQQSAAQLIASRSTYSWLYRVVLDSLINASRKHSSGPRDVHREIPLPESSSLQLGCNLIGRGPGPATLLQQEESRELIRRAMAKLKDSDREVLWMRQGDQLSFSEIGDVLDITENAATVRYARALGRLHQLWQELCPDFGSTL